MDTTKYTTATLCLAFAFAAANAAGLPMALGMGDAAPTGSTLGDSLEQQASESVAENPDGITGENQGVGDNSIITLILDGVTFLLLLVANLALLPLTLAELGLSTFFAYPAGFMMQIISSIGIIEFVGNREWS